MNKRWISLLLERFRIAFTANVRVKYIDENSAKRTGLLCKRKTPTFY